MWIEYKDGKPDPFLHSEGSVRADKDGQFKYYFVLRDHLGNTRVTFSDLNQDDEINEKEEIIQINNYYAFGLNMEGNWNGKDGANQYQYNGKEWNDDFGLDWNDYGARWYDPAIGKWTTVDPLAAKYSDVSPYIGIGNNPIKYIDPNGLEIIVPKLGDRERVLAWIHSRSQGEFKFDDNGKLYLVSDNSKTGYSEDYKQQLITEIGSHDTQVIIAIGDEFDVPTDTKLYETNVKEGQETGGKIKVADFNGGATLSSKDFKKQYVYLDGKDYTGIAVKNWLTGETQKVAESETGAFLRCTAEDIAMHEMLGHALPRSKGGAAVERTGNAIDNENKGRAQNNRPELKDAGIKRKDNSWEGHSQ